tara:strand:+ start:112 stop:840 length:729 start_codon:yes stop_codon:yes gene_type:complete
MGQRIDPLAMALGLGSMGLNIIGGLDERNRAYNEQRRQIKEQNKQAIASRNFQNLQIRKQNEFARKAYETQVGIYNQQRELNLEAANRAYEGIQVNRNRQLQALAFRRENLSADLLEAVGANTAAIDPGNRSAQLAAAKGTYGTFGRMQAQDKMQARDLAETSKLKIRDVAGQQRAADLQAYSQVAIAPYMQSELPPAFQMSMPSGPSLMSNISLIGGGLLGGLSTYNQFAPEKAQIGYRSQ